ncbi:MAG: serine/threonine-protein phosphatase [Lachnospiraceae bacterium]|nr:serine/threonine-protein phosphatase [Lachnospiraceae bacterium]
MRFEVIAETDIGNVKDTNQDSVLVKHASTPSGEVLMACMCDGMGGLSRGELASATVIRAFNAWFEKMLPYDLVEPDLHVIGSKWTLLLKELNVKIMKFGLANRGNLGTTFTGMLFIGDEYMIVHIGDSRAYYLGSELRLLTEDQTYVQREINRGNMTPEQAKTDPKRNMLLQCVGASRSIEPVVIYGKTEKGAYMLCSDGFRHEISTREMYESLNPVNLINKNAMHSNCRYLIDLVKSRKERDNISVILIKTE